MLLIVAAHLGVALAAPAMVRWWGRRTFWALAVVPAGTFCWVLAQTGASQTGAGLVQSTSWVPSIGLELSFRLGVLQWLLALVVVGIGALVLVYCAWYFADDDATLGRFSSLLLAFVGVMLGLVLADDLLLVYVFWELTTVLSFLLIGHDAAKREARQAAVQALVVTTLGGLAMLVGFLLLAQQAGTFRISAILADPPPAGGAVTVAVLLALLGAATKSALVPFHFWLPAAMAAPTPVSAYLHAASMVKAGVYLVALLAPAFAGVPGWRGALLGLGVATMLLGGWRALRQLDVKLLLAYGTVSQLGFLLVVLGTGSRSAALAGGGLLLAHALFKSTLFLVVGIVDKQTGTRDLRELNGVGRQMPAVAVAATVAAVSMAGVPPLLGFVGKEAVLYSLVDAARHDDGTGLGGLAGWAVLIGVVLGSVLTVAYSARFVWGTFATKDHTPGTPGSAPAPTTQVRRVPAGFAGVPVVLGALCLLLGFAGPALTDALTGYADAFAPGYHEPELTLWHGLGLPLLLSAVTLAGGLTLFALKIPVARLQARLHHDLSADRAYRFALRGLDRLAVETTGLVQRGSVAAYLAVILVVVVLVPGSALLRGNEIRVTWWDTPAQAVVGVLMVGAAVSAARARRRLRAVVLAGVTGYGCAVLFVLHGAPDIALTQILVETVSIVVFVLVLRRLPEYFTVRPLTGNRFVRMAIGAAVAVVVAGFMLVSGSARTAEPVSAAFPEESVDFGGGKNIVNVILVDIRAWDTFGEIAVLVVAATGVASLIFLNNRSSTIRRVHEIPYPGSVRKQPTTPGRRVWLAGPRTLQPDRRSIVFEVVTRLLFHSMIVFSIYLLVAGHNLPGGGFAAAITTGLALAVRYLAGGRYELDEAAPVDAGRLIGAGLAVAAVAAAAPMLVGGTVLQSGDYYIPIGPLGELHLVTSVFFDIGVYLVVVGLVLDLLRALGSRIDRQVLREQREREEPEDSGDTGDAGDAGGPQEPEDPESPVDPERARDPEEVRS